MAEIVENRQENKMSEMMNEHSRLQEFTIQPARLCQLDQILDMYSRARQFMAEHNNPTQWPADYPSRDMVADDIEAGFMFACMDGQELAAVFYYRAGEEPEYENIRDGCWLNQEPYGVVHRITTGGGRRGAGSFCLNWAWRQCGNLKIDTHRDNAVMQNLLKKNGFQYCGIIRGRDGGERLAYQKEKP